MRTIRLLILIIAVFGTTIMRAQTPLPVSAVAAARADAVAADPDMRSVRLLVGRSTLVDVATPIARVSLTSPDIADALVTSPNQLLINGKVPGTISMFVWDRSGSIRRYEVIVQRDLARLAEQVRELFPGDAIDVQSNGRNIVLSGTVSNKDVIERAVNVASGYVDKKEEVVTLLQVRDGGASNQVLLRVRFAEVSRSAMTDLGSSFFTGANGTNNVIGRATTGQFAAPSFTTDSTSGNSLVFSDFLNLFLFDTKNQIGTVIQALQNKGLFQSLAEPNLVAESGKEASFLAGGEIPIPIAQGSGNAVAISVQYKEFGIRLNFTPVVNGDRVHLKVRPEVSTLDFTNAVTLNGFRIPALSTRRTETEIELMSGQTFAIAGLLSDTVNSSLQKIPGIGDIPILGMLFQSKSAQKNKTELVVMITPEILPRGSYGVTTTLPRMQENMLPPLPDKRSVPAPPAAFKPGGAMSAVTPAAAPAAAPAPVATAAPVAAAQAATPSPAAAAATLNALVPTAPKPATLAPAAPAAQAAPADPAKNSSLPSRSIETPASTVTRPLTEQEQKMLARAHKAEQEATAQAQAKAVDAEREQAKKDQKAQEKAAREQAKRDVEAAKHDAELAKRQAEYDKQQAEAQKKQQKAIDEAEARAKAAEAAYQSELNKAKKQ